MNTRLPRHAQGIGIIIACLAMLVPLPLIAAKEGFGMFLSKKVANLTRVNPPKVYLMGTRIAVRAASPDPQHADVAQRIQSQLESELLSNDSRLTADAARPQTLIEITVTQNDYNESWETR